MKKKAILSLLMLGSMVGSTINMNAGWFSKVSGWYSEVSQWDDERSPAEKAYKKLKKISKKKWKYAKAKLPKYIIDNLIKHTASAIATCIFTYCVVKVYALVKNKLQGNKKNGVYLSPEQQTKLEAYISKI